MQGKLPTSVLLDLPTLLNISILSLLPDDPYPFSYPFFM